VIPATDAWKRCSTCKDPIGFESRYYLCSVSTCNRKRMTLVFCSVGCWDAHQADARHRDAGAEEARSPTAAAWAREVSAEKEKAQAKTGDPGSVVLKRVTGATSLDTLVVTAKLKDYIRARAGMSTADRVIGVLSDHLRKLCDQAIEAAGRDGRRTVMDRDVAPFMTRGLESAATGAGDPDDRLDDVSRRDREAQGVHPCSRRHEHVGFGAARALHSRATARAPGHSTRRYDDRKTVLDRDFLQALSRTPPS